MICILPSENWSIRFRNSSSTFSRDGEESGVRSASASFVKRWCMVIGAHLTCRANLALQYCVPFSTNVHTAGRFISALSVTGRKGQRRQDRIGSRSDQIQTATSTRRRRRRTAYTREVEKLIRGPRKAIDQKRPSTALHVSEDLRLKQIHDQADGTELALVHGLLHHVPDAEGAGVLERPQHLPRAEVDQAQILGQTCAERAFARAGAAWISRSAVRTRSGVRAFSSES
ncbi:hypothetical protein VTN02DRAFT_4127 [Thermoascus thermophilus]